MNKTPPDPMHPQSRAEWRRRLEKNYRRTEGVWPIRHKKASGKPCMDYDEMLDGALCFGWVDSKMGRLDGEPSLLWFAPRRAGTAQAERSRQRVEKSIREKWVTPDGQAKVNAAKKDGRRGVLDAMEALEFPEDREDAFSKNATAGGCLEASPRPVKRGSAGWIFERRNLKTRKNASKRQSPRRRRIPCRAVAAVGGN